MKPQFRISVWVASRLNIRQWGPSLVCLGVTLAGGEVGVKVLGRTSSDKTV